MLYNKYQFSKTRNEKVLHKVKKQWVTVSVALFALIGGGTLTNHVNASSNNNGNNKTNHHTQSNNTDQSKARLITASHTPANNRAASTREIQQGAERVHDKILAHAMMTAPTDYTNSTHNNINRRFSFWDEPDNYSQETSYYGTSVNGKPVRSINNPDDLRLNQAGYYKGYVFSRITTPFSDVRSNDDQALHSSIFLNSDNVGALRSGHQAHILKAFKHYGHDRIYTRYLVNIHHHNYYITGNPRYTSFVAPSRHYRYYQHKLNDLLNNAQGDSFNNLKKTAGKLNHNHVTDYRRYMNLYINAYNLQQKISHPITVNYHHEFVSSDNAQISNSSASSQSTPVSSASSNSIASPSFSFSIPSFNVPNVTVPEAPITPSSNSTNPNGSSSSPNNSNSKANSNSASNNASNASSSNSNSASSASASASKSRAASYSQSVSNSVSQSNKSVASSKALQTNIDNIRSRYNYLENNEDSNDISTASNQSRYRQHVIDWVNFYRTDIYGLKPVTESPDFDAKAQNGADNGTDPEDILMGDPNSSQALDPSDVSIYFTDTNDADYDGAPGHRTSILNPRSSNIGVGMKGGQDTLFLNYGRNNAVTNNDQGVMAYPNVKAFPYEYSNQGKSDYWGFSFIEPNSVEPDETPSTYKGILVNNPQVSVHDDTANLNVNVSDVHNDPQVGKGYTLPYCGAVFYKVDTTELKPGHQYTITISGQGIPNGSYQYTTKLFNLANN